MAQVALASEIRTATGKGVARKLRAAGKIPGVLYGPSMEPIHLQLDEKSVQQLIQSKGVNRIIELTVTGSEAGKHLCLIKEVARDIYQQKVTHLDLRKLDLDEQIVANVRVLLEGEQVLRAKGGIVEQMVRTIKVRTKAVTIPDKFTVDISGLRLGQTITIGEVPLPQDVELVDNPESPIVNIFAARGALIAQQG
jgi:large subunit ribosomal protein L25